MTSYLLSCTSSEKGYTLKRKNYLLEKTPLQKGTKIISTVISPESLLIPLQLFY